MTITVTPFLRNALNADALISGAAALLMIAGAPFLSPLLELPSGLLMGAGLVLLPFVGFLAWLGRRPSISRLSLVDVLIINAAWTVASFTLIFSGMISPNGLGVAFIAAQALAVAALTQLQYVGLRRAAA